MLGDVKEMGRPLTTGEREREKEREKERERETQVDVEEISVPLATRE